MSGGLLDLIGNRGFMERLAKRDSLIVHLAAWAGTTPEMARVWLDAQDAHALETFKEGNKYPREQLH